jgi:hypothetical protein
MLAASMGCHEPWTFHGCVTLSSQVLHLRGGLLVVLCHEDDMVAASLVCHEPWIFRGCVVIASQVLE